MVTSILNEDKYEKFLFSKKEFMSHERYSEFMDGNLPYDINGHSNNLTHEQKEMIVRRLLNLNNPPKFFVIHNLAEDNKNKTLKYKMKSNPSIKYDEFIKYDGFIPYPNFTKQYARIWHPQVKYIKPDWKKEAIWYYSECLDFFNDPNRVKYYDYYPTEESKLKLKKYIKESFIDKKISYDKINEEYETECFDGNNFEEFAMERWNNEFNRVVNFINNTLDRLNSLNGEDKCL